MTQTRSRLKRSIADETPPVTRRTRRRKASPAKETSRPAPKQTILSLRPLAKPIAAEVEPVPPPAVAVKANPFHHPAHESRENGVTCRQKESFEIQTALEKAVRSKQGTTLYVSGVPGTGKTHTIKSVLMGLDWKNWNADAPSLAYVNCMSSGTAKLPNLILQGLLKGEALARKITHTQGGGHTTNWLEFAYASLADSSPSQGDDPLTQVRKLAHGHHHSAGIAPRTAMMILVLDELDHACKTAESLIRDLFSIAMSSNSRLVVIGIANKLDLTERLLQDLKACQAAPVVLPFMSYTAKQILQVLKERYEAAFVPKALEWIARRIASASGDMRAAISTCESALSVASAEHDTDGASVSDTGLPDVTVAQVAIALNQSGSCVSSQAQRHVAVIQKLPMDQKLLLCTLSLARAAALPTPAPTPAPVLQRNLQNFFPSSKVGARKPMSGALASLERSNTSALQALAKGTRGKGAIISRGLDGVLATPVKVKRVAQGQVDMTLDAILSGFRKTRQDYFLNARADQLPDMSQVKHLLDNLIESGLLGCTAADGSCSRKAAGVLKPSSRIALIVSTDDVKHALADCKILQPLIKKLP